MTFTEKEMTNYFILSHGHFSRFSNYIRKSAFASHLNVNYFGWIGIPWGNQKSKMNFLKRGPNLPFSFEMVRFAFAANI
jgi:hypothetical protein